MDVLAEWGSGTAKVDAVDGGATNETWRVSTDERVQFLRRYRTRDGDAIRREHALIGHVADAGVRTPRPIPALNGESLIRSDDSFFALFETASGRQLEPDELGIEHATSAGRFLAALHMATASLPIEDFRQPKLHWDGVAWADRVRATAAAIPTHDPSEVDRWAHRRSIEQAAWLEHLDCAHSYDPVGRLQVIHGDFQHANLFFRGAEVSAVIDWDTTVAICRAFEVVRACAFMFHLEPTRSGTLLAAYRSASPLSADELADGARAWGCFADHHVWPIEERYLHGNHAAERFIPRRPFRPFRDEWADASLE